MAKNCGSKRGQVGGWIEYEIDCAESDATSRRNPLECRQMYPRLGYKLFALSAAFSNSEKESFPSLLVSSSLNRASEVFRRYLPMVVPETANLETAFPNLEVIKAYVYRDDRLMPWFRKRITNWRFINYSFLLDAYRDTDFNPRALTHQANADHSPTNDAWIQLCEAATECAELRLSAFETHMLSLGIPPKVEKNVFGALIMDLTTADFATVRELIARNSVQIEIITLVKNEMDDSVPWHDAELAMVEAEIEFWESFAPAVAIQEIVQ